MMAPRMTALDCLGFALRCHQEPVDSARRDLAVRYWINRAIEAQKGD